MNPYENALIKVVEHMLNERNCNVRNNLVRDKLVLILRTRLRYVAESITNGSNHAGRTTPSYFDVERTLRQLGVQVQELRALRLASEVSQQSPPVTFSASETLDEDFHHGPQVDMYQERGSRCGRHIPKFLPPFPSLHTYRNTIMEIYTDRNYVSQRERRAQHRINTQSALNGYYVRTCATMSLFIESQRGTEFLLLSSTVPEQPAYRNALMPRDEIFDENIYEFNEEPNEKAKGNMFLKPAQLESTRPAVQTCDVDLGYKTNETAAEPDEENSEEADAKELEEFENEITESPKGDDS